MAVPTTPRATPTELGEIAVWEGFRGLRCEGEFVHERLARELLTGDFLDARGETVELGGGDGVLWRTGGTRLVDRALAAGPLVITDLDRALIDGLAAVPLLARPGIALEVADVLALPFPSRRFARAIAVHVLHWCGTQERVGRAVSELARVLRTDGRALVVTVDETVHMAEVYRMLREAAAELRAGGIECEPMPLASPRVLPFCAGNAEVHLRASFAVVRRIDHEFAHLCDAVHPTLGIRGEAFLTSYVRTLPFVRAGLAEGRIPPGFPAVVDRRFAQTLAAGPLRMSRRDVVFECARPL